MEDRKILASWIMAPDGTMIPSFHRHNFREHITIDSWRYDDDDSTLIPSETRYSMSDGGTDYLRRGGVYTEMSIYSDDHFEVIRRFLCRGGRGEDGTSPLTYVPLFRMDEQWLKECIRYNERLGIEGHNEYYKKELIYRNEQILIANNIIV